jgi:hypothetical protein
VRRFKISEKFETIVGEREVKLSGGQSMQLPERYKIQVY